MAKLPYGWWTPEKRLDAAHGLENGETREAIAARLGVTVIQLRDALNNHGVLGRYAKYERARMRGGAHG